MFSKGRITAHGKDQDFIFLPDQTTSTPHRTALIASFLGWMLDSFDFFLVAYCLTAIGNEFRKSDAEIAISITVTLAFRPLGAILVGLVADRFGRRLPMIINILFYSLAEIFTGLCHSFSTFMVLRALFGIGMGGQWGVGASLAIEQAPVRRRGVLSGLLQQGYAAGNLFAALCYFLLFDRWGWRPLFFIGSVPALLLVAFTYFRVNESEVWQQTRGGSWKGLGGELKSNWKLFIYSSVFMMAMQFAAHGTQDMYPTFLQRQWHFGPMHRSAIAGFSMIGAIIGGVVMGYLSDWWGRRRAMVVAFVLAILTIPLWVYAPSVTLLVGGAFIMQFMVQGAWGVVPAHMTELSPDSVRALLTGVAYQCGALLSSSVVYFEAVFAQRFSYSEAMASIALIVFILASVVAAVGRERHGAIFGSLSFGD